MARASRYQAVKGEILAQIAKTEASHAKPPAVRDLAEVHEVSVSTMHSFLTKMNGEGLIEWKPGRHRSLRLTPQGSQASSRPGQ